MLPARLRTPKNSSHQNELSIAADNEQTYAMAAGDVNSDGVLDFVTSNESGENGISTDILQNGPLYYVVLVHLFEK